ncbi:MAG: PTS system mannose/fructose/sorbose family transporter subunit IID [Anaerolineae bacterium]|nr:PTS system mannose/fructose/sorbose family transporter subunit IID [Anaerolineae bacterium]
MSAKKKTLERSDLIKSWVIWEFFSHALYNWQRLQGTAFAHMMVPIIEKLYDTKEEISAALKRHLVFFNTQPTFGAIIHGIAVALEEERANGAEISDEAINGLKTALMGPLAGLGDTLQQGLLIPIMLSLCIGIAMEGNFLGPVIYIIVLCAFEWVVSYLAFFSGYRWGKDAIDRLLSGGLMQKVTTAASVVGLIVAGVLMVRFVNVRVPVTITTGDLSINVGTDILDRILPGIPALVTTLLVWRALQKKVSANRIVLVIFVVGFVGGWLGILGGGGWR